MKTNMADTEFEEFRQTFESLQTQHSRNIAPFYSLVHDLDDAESPTSPKSELETRCTSSTAAAVPPSENCTSFRPPDVETQEAIHTANETAPIAVSNPWTATNGNGGEQRRRRKLPEIPKNKKSAVVTMYNAQQQLSREMSLADELVGSSSGPNSVLILKCGYLWDDSPESDRVLTDADSGHSTAHSPSGTDGPKSMSPVLGAGETAAVGAAPSYFGDGADSLEATHRGLHRFVPRHPDEIDVEIGDPIYVQKEADDLWCEGVNLRTGRIGIFPSAYAVDCDYSDWDSTCEHGRRERYLLGYIGSVETLAHKGTSVVCQAVRRVISNSGSEPEVQLCTLEVSEQGLRMVDRQKRNKNEPCIDYFYSLKNVSFCAFHPRDHRYLGFITKHPTLQRFACHVFRGQDSTRPIAEAVGRAFQKFYQKFIETAYPVEDIYIE